MPLTTKAEALARPRQFLTQLFETAVAASTPKDGMKAHLPVPPKGRTIVVGAGKAAGEMAIAFEELWPHPLEGAVVSRHGSTARPARLRLLTAAHPVPDQAGLEAAETLLKLVQGLSADDLVIALISGGGSALLPAPAAGLTLQDEMELNRILLESGAPISAMNAIRKQFSRIKGGRLAQAASPARVVTFVVSDIPGDVLPLVASGPTLPDETTKADAEAALANHNIVLPEKLKAFLATAPQAPRPSDAAFRNHEVHLVASAARSLQAAAKASAALGIPAHILSDAIEGETRDIAKMHAAMALSVKRTGQPFTAPCLILSGGETTVTIGPQGAGKGGRNSEFQLSFAASIAGAQGIHALAADTDGIDGSENNAGAFADGATIDAIKAKGADPARLLMAHDSWTALNHAGNIFVTGHTGTNVNDFRAILITG
ncbi:MAG: glycerate kinase [Alphaproteobacteria bacterium]|nr:glycerate kinase [Alphaproteobacteria bacterium]